MKNLTDLEVCKRIADIEGVEINQGILKEDELLVTVPESGYLQKTYNPLDDDALCFRLSKKYRCSINYLEEWERQQEDADTLSTIEIGDGIFARAFVRITKENDLSINKAICLAIIEANK